MKNNSKNYEMQLTLTSTHPKTTQKESTINNNNQYILGN